MLKSKENALKSGYFAIFFKNSGYLFVLFQNKDLNLSRNKIVKIMELNFDIFSGKKTKGIKSHISNLVAIAKSDGNFSIKEKRLIFEIGKRNGLSNDKLKSIIKSEEPIKFKVPKTDADRFDRVYDLVEMAVVDGTEDHENEIESCIEIAEKLGFRKAVVGVLVRKLAFGIINGKTKEELRKESSDFLSL